MSRVLIVGDIHLSDKPPSSCTDSYTDDLFDILAHTVRLESDLGCDATVWAGDVFHVRTPSRTSHKLVLRAVELVQKYKKLFIVPGNHDMCVSEDSEALTDSGWKTLDQLDGTERFATLNPQTHSLEWQIPNRLFVSHRTEPMLHFKSPSVDHLVTPEHDLYVQNTDLRAPDQSWRKLKADSAPSYARWRVLSSTQEWNGTVEDVVIPAFTHSTQSKAKGEASKVLDLKFAASLFGWYLSEGSCEPQRVTISQSVEMKPENYREIVTLLTDLGYDPRQAPKMVRVGSYALSKFLADNFGSGSYNLKIPSWVKEWPRELLQILLDSYLKGDGTPNGSGWSARTASDVLAGDLQEICVKLGYTATIGSRREFPFAGSEYTGTAVTVSITQRTQLGLPGVKEVPYDGRVWCPEVPNGIWMVRRNGRALWTGNSPGDRLDSVFETQPLGVLLQAGACLLDGWDVSPDALPLYGVPWQQKWSEMEAGDALIEWNAESEETCAKALIVAHAPFYPPSQELPYEYYPLKDSTAIEGETRAPWPALQRNGFMYYGHVHDAHGIYEVDGVTFANHGAISRGSLSEADVSREIAVTIWDSEEGFSRVPVPHKPASEVFRMAQAQEVKSHEMEVSAFLEAVGTTTLDISTTESALESLKSMNVSDRVRSLVEELLNDAG